MSGRTLAEVLLKKCPHCAEEIQDEAKVCTHCGHGLETGLTEDELPRWNRGVAAVLSLLIPGAGQMYKGQTVGGIAWLIVVVLSYIFVLVPGFLLHLFCIVGAYMGDQYKEG